MVSRAGLEPFNGVDNRQVIDSTIRRVRMIRTLRDSGTLIAPTELLSECPEWLHLALHTRSGREEMIEILIAGGPFALHTYDMPSEHPLTHWSRPFHPHT